jgi:CRISPR/Cas system-associated exonuclease Cas4 (RecB family)
MNTPPPLTAQHIAALLTCPRTLWWRYIAGLNPPPNAAMRRSATLHDLITQLPADTLNQHLNLDATRYERERPLQDPHWRARLDLLAYLGLTWLPIELKLTHLTEPTTAHILQLTLYAHLLSPYAPTPITHGLLWLIPPPMHTYSPDHLTPLLNRASLHHIEIAPHIPHLQKIQQELLDLLHDEAFPHDPDRTACDTCPFPPFCQDRHAPRTEL